MASCSWFFKPHFLGHSFVIDQRADFFQKEAQQRASGDVADLFIHVFTEIALNGRDGLGSVFFGDVYADKTSMFSVLVDSVVSIRSQLNAYPLLQRNIDAD